MNTESHTTQPLAYSVNDAIRLTSIGRTKLYELIGQGRLKSVRIGGRVLIPADSLRALITGEA